MKKSLYDVLGDDKIRPNQLFAFSTTYPVWDFKNENTMKILETIEDKLLLKYGLRTLSIGIALRYLGELSYDWSLINAISVIGTIPMVLVFFFFQKYMIKGLVAGAVKG